jgi:FAD/FMN-containing dehydrogenase
VASYLREGGILLDVSQLRDIKIDVDTRVAHVQPGILGAEFSFILSEHGLAFPVAHCPTVALGGYLLGGGMGWNGEHWNRFACFNVEAIDLVSAAGERLTVKRDVHPDLFWAARGAGPAFCGIVTRYHLKVFPLPRAIAQSTYVFSIDQIDNIIAWLEQARQRQDSKIEMSFIMESDDGEKQCVLSAVCFADDEAEGKRLLSTGLQDIPEQGRLFAKEFHPVSFAEVLALTFTSAPNRLANETAWAQTPPVALQAMAEQFVKAPAGRTVIIANFRSNTDLPEDTAFSVTAPLFLNWSTRWDSTADDDLHMQWMDEVAESMEAVMSGCYVNETDFIRRPHWARKCFSEANWKRLASINKRYDPDAILPPPFALDT